MENSNIRDFGKPKDGTIDKIDSAIATQIDTTANSNKQNTVSSPQIKADDIIEGSDKQMADIASVNSHYNQDESKVQPVAADEDNGAAVSSAGGAANGAEQQPEELPPKPKGCDKCGKKFGLTGGFACRCGGTFCAFHRYSDRHDCSFDYRELGASEIRRDNPVIVPEKLRKL
ncbi:uncharacterized protein LOC132796754 [Drosophila nasuta]|uniref:uncharacterized protein LOC132796754 n=1 Tax=Drosophila nasuta TaxID=42062 RepID=UPI00295E71F3|nr:uncharacterized protein LOC132796754 [Drosophila nasuta]